MLRSQLIANIKLVQLTRSTSSTSSQKKWDLVSAVCIERKPQIVPEMDEMQMQFNEQLRQIEFEKSYKSAHEIRHQRDLVQMESLKKGDHDADMALKETAQDFLDKNNDELKKFQYAPKTTEADRNNDETSLNRKLQQSLVLVTKQKVGDKDYFLLPQAIHNDGETLRQTAERVLKDQVGKDIKAQIYSNAPMGFYKYKYPKIANNSAIGAKVFIYFARHQSGDKGQKEGHKWLDRKELHNELPDKYRKSLSMLLVDE